MQLAKTCTLHENLRKQIPKRGRLQHEEGVTRLELK